MKLLFATHNFNKIIEIKPELPPRIELLNLKNIGFYDDIPETGNSLDENAYEKARFIFDKFGINTFADDTGLEVETLNNEPGIFSARYAGEQRNSEDNIKKLLANLQGITNRKARFRTVISLITNKKILSFEGIVNGSICSEPRGRGGFGYDAVFLPEDYTKTFAEMNLYEKNLISHRAIAIKKLIAFLDHSF